MFGHIYCNRLKINLRNKSTLFWMLIFPILLSTLFHFALSELLSAETFETIPIAVIENDAYHTNESFRQTLDAVSKKDGAEKALLAVTATDLQSAQQLLKDETIKGYINLNPEPALVVSQSGFSQTILKNFLDDYIQTAKAVTTIVEKNPSSLQNGLIEKMEHRATYIKDVYPAKAQPNNTMIYFYTVIAMVCLFVSFRGIGEVNAIQANLSYEAARTSLAPANKLKTFLAGILAAFTVQCGLLLVLFGYMIFILKVQFGSNLPFIAVTCAIGSLCGLFLGAIFGAVLKAKADTKETICAAFVMLLCMLSGMMGSNMKYFFEQAIPALRYLNPAGLITDSLYSLYYFDTYSRFFTDIALLSVIAVVLAAGTLLILRRQRYASI